VIATAETVYVMVDAALQKQPIPDVFRRALEGGAPGVVTDHAAWRRPISERNSSRSG
jgi:acyl-CoA thioester hydrolase